MGVMSSIDVDIREMVRGELEQELVRNEIQAFCHGRKLLLQLSDIAQLIINKYIDKNRRPR